MSVFLTLLTLEYKIPGVPFKRSMAGWSVTVLFGSQMLLGMYRCTDIPGKFVWQPGTLTQAVSKGQWILLEDIDHAPLDVVSSGLLTM